jgi:Kef-type K+ transport system membrane component KefB
MDASLVWHAGKKPFIIAITSLSIPMMITFLTYLCFQNQIGYQVNSKHNFLLFLMATFCNSFFFVQAEVLSDLGLLSSELGRLALSASIIQDFILYCFIPVFNSFNQSQIGNENVIMHLLSFAIMVSFIILVIRPYAMWVIRNTPSHGCVRYLIKILNN